MNEKNVVISVIVLVIVIVGGWYLLKNKSVSVPATTTETPSENTMSAEPTSVTVTLTDEGFSPKSVTVPFGSTVTFVNQSAAKMWVTSDPHPTHEWYDGSTKSVHCANGYKGTTPFDQCATGDSYSFTFTKAGSWGYHNHSGAGERGTIIVTAATTN